MDSSQPSQTVDLSNCDREPIHIIGRIQSFGYLISFSSDWIINHASVNWEELTGLPATDMIGCPAHDWLASDGLHALRTRLQMLSMPDSVERLFDIDVLGDGRLFDIATHVSGRSIIAELEPSADKRRGNYIDHVRPMVDRMRAITSTEELCQTAARQIRALTGFDRVMVYRFAPDGSGEVIAESLAGNTDSFKGLHFPASDIPAQARKLYMRNILRIISDVNDPTAEVLPAVNPDGEPLDLSMSSLRAVSPIHIEYLKNMGVQASMSISIMQRDKFWGLFACHHYKPLILPYSLRTAAELFGEMFSYLLERVETDTMAERQEKSTRLHDQLMARLAGGEKLLTNFDEFADMISSVIPCDGMAGWVDGEYVSRGTTLTREQFKSLARFLNTTGASRIWSTDNLSAAHPPAAEYADCCAGLLALPVSRMPRDYIVLFRKEVVHSVHWAGNPEKSVELGPNGARLTPRKSFDLWKEEVRGHSTPWKPEEIRIAEHLRITLIEVVLRLTDAANREREQASKRQDILIAELNHRVRNILNLIRSLVTQSKRHSETIEQFADLVGSRIQALARAHDQVTQTNWSPASLQGLIRTEGKAYLSERMNRVQIDGTDVMILPAAFTPLALVFHELMTNSTKYGALSADDGHIFIKLIRQQDDSLVIDWQEKDGPAVTPPTHRGFGSAIIEQTFPHELQGTADIDYAPAGLRARFMLPPAHIAYFTTFKHDEKDEREMTDQPVGDTPLSGQVLILEDNMLIALEVEEVLNNLGAERCHVAGSINGAIRILNEHDISFALLDVNLGNETSEEIALSLQEKGTPFIFATGYGEISSVSGAFDKVATVTKPFTIQDIIQAIRRSQAG